MYAVEGPVPADSRRWRYSHDMATDTNWCQPIPADTNRYQLIPTDTNWYQPIPTDTDRCQLIPTRLRDWGSRACGGTSTNTAESKGWTNTETWERKTQPLFTEWWRQTYSVKMFGDKKWRKELACSRWVSVNDDAACWITDVTGITTCCWLHTKTVASEALSQWGTNPYTRLLEFGADCTLLAGQGHAFGNFWVLNWRSNWGESGEIQKRKYNDDKSS
jgi:hypothetical protein